MSTETRDSAPFGGLPLLSSASRSTTSTLRVKLQTCLFTHRLGPTPTKIPLGPDSPCRSRPLLRSLSNTPSHPCPDCDRGRAPGGPVPTPRAPSSGLFVGRGGGSSAVCRTGVTTQGQDEGRSCLPTSEGSATILGSRRRPRLPPRSLDPPFSCLSPNPQRGGATEEFPDKGGLW